MPIPGENTQNLLYLNIPRSNGRNLGIRFVYHLQAAFFVFKPCHHRQIVQYGSLVTFKNSRLRSVFMISPKYESDRLLLAFLCVEFPLQEAQPFLVPVYLGELLIICCAPAGRGTDRGLIDVRVVINFYLPLGPLLR